MSDEDGVMALVEKLAEAAYGNGHEAGAIKDYVSRVNELPMELAIRERLEAALNNAYAEGRKDGAEERAWRPIETAPIDERILIAATPDWVCEGLVEVDTEADDNGPEVRSYHWANGDRIHRNNRPIAWMPLPKHPEAT